MVATLKDNSWAVGSMTFPIPSRGIRWGLIGGLLGMLVVDLLIMGALFVAGLSPLDCISTVGDTVARFFSLLGIKTAGGALMSVATHYLAGPVLGAIYGAGLARVATLRVVTLKKCIALAVLYGEIVSQPLFATIPILLKMGASETLFWYVGSLVMHFIWGIVLGVFVSRGLR